MRMRWSVPRTIKLGPPEEEEIESKHFRPRPQTRALFSHSYSQVGKIGEPSLLMANKHPRPLLKSTAIKRRFDLDSTSLSASTVATKEKAHSNAAG